MGIIARATFASAARRQSPTPSPAPSPAPSPSPSLRPATPADADDIVDLTIAAGDGLPLVLWQALAPPGMDPRLLGRQRARRPTGGYSYTRAEMATVDGAVAGAIIDYALADSPEPVTAETPALVVPLNELENLVCGSWYVNILAVKPHWQRRGIGRMLLAAADRRARDHGKRVVSIIVSDANQAARTLYRAHGFTRLAQRPMVKPGWHGPGDHWLLLTKQV
ncbi:MAG: GNAT family N-acetyltransferase [Rhodospirillaceae bacterium]|nr:GNAT family N-acetyltransferase [Rhodospirillaceae bacterium]